MEFWKSIFLSSLLFSYSQAGWVVRLILAGSWQALMVFTVSLQADFVFLDLFFVFWPADYQFTDCMWTNLILCWSRAEAVFDSSLFTTGDSVIDYFNEWSAVLDQLLCLKGYCCRDNKLISSITSRWSIIRAPLYLYPQKTDVSIRRLDYGREAVIMVPGSGSSEDWEETKERNGEGVQLFQMFLRCKVGWDCSVNMWHRKKANQPSQLSTVFGTWVWIFLLSPHHPLFSSISFSWEWLKMVMKMETSLYSYNLQMIQNAAARVFWQESAKGIRSLWF